MKIKHFGIVAKDPKLLKQFYSELLETQLSFNSETSEYGEFSLDPGTKLDIEPFDVLSKETRPHDPTDAKVLIRIETDNIDVVFEKLKANKFNVISSPTDRAWKERSLYLLDPEGNLIEVFQKI